MSHQVTITRTTTTTTSSGIFLNTAYIKSWPGLLKLAELILGAICVGMVGYYIAQDRAVVSANAEFYFILAAFACLVGTFSLLMACVLSLATGSVVSKTIYELVYHSLAFLLYLSASLNFIIQVNKDNRHYYGGYRVNHYEPYLAVSIIGLVVSALYLLSAIVAYRSYKLV